MPYPTQGEIAALPGRNCPPPPIPLQSIIDSINAASPAEQTAFYSLISSNAVNIFAIVNGIEAGNSTDQANLRALLQVNSGSGGTVGPAGPPGPPGPGPTLSAMLEAIDTADSADQATFKNTIVDVPTWLNTLGQLNVPMLYDAIKAIFNECGATITLGVNWHFGSGETVIHTGYTPPCAFDITGEVYLGSPPASGGTPVDFATEIVQYVDCEGGTYPAEPSQLNLTLPSSNGLVSGLGAALTLIFQKLAQLERCCPSCYYTTPNKTDTIRGFGQAMVNPSRVDSIQFNVDLPGDPNFNLVADPNFGQFGKFQWIDEQHNFRPVQYINVSGQIFHAPSANCIGFWYSLAEGTQLIYKMVVRDGTVTHYGVQ